MLSLAVAALASVPLAQSPCPDVAHVSTLGMGTVGSLGVPELIVIGAPVIGGTFALQVQNGAPSALGLIVFSEGAPVSPLSVPQYGGVFYPSGLLHVLPFQLDTGGESALLRFTSALGPEVCGRLCVLQAAILDVGATGGGVAVGGPGLEVWGSENGPL